MSGGSKLDASIARDFHALYVKEYGGHVSAHWRWWVRLAIVIIFASVVAIGIPTVRHRILQSAGRALVVGEQGIQPADIIVVATDTDGAGTLEAADLVHSGVSGRVAVLPELPKSTVESEFVRRGIPYENAAVVSIRQLRLLGVESIEEIPRTVEGSEEEGQVLPGWCDQHKFRSVVVVTTSDHSRRLHRILVRSMKGHQTRITVRSSRYTNFDPDRWWETRGGVRTEIIEFEKLLVDFALHPISSK